MQALNTKTMQPTFSHKKSCKLSTTKILQPVQKNQATSPQKNHATSLPKKNTQPHKNKSCKLSELEKSRNLSKHKNHATSPHTKSRNLSAQKIMQLLNKQACCTGCRSRPIPMKLHQWAKSIHSAKSP